MRRSERLAAEFILENGDPWERWRVRRVLGENPPLPPGWAMRQMPDGGWAPRHWPHEAELGTSIRQLLTLAWLGLGDSQETARTAAYLETAQQKDGRWTDRGQRGAAARPDRRADISHTALAAAGLAVLGRGAGPAVAAAAGHLGALQEAAGNLPGYPLATAAWAGLHWRLGNAAGAGAALDWVRGRLEPGWDPVEVVAGLQVMLLAGVPSDHPAAAALAAALRTQQAPRGYWPTAYRGEELDLTAAALEVLARVAP